MHFTYNLRNPNQLFQGDIIRRTPEVDAILKIVHPHYHQSPSYKYFIILTQSCDLVCRTPNSPSSEYISIAAVRPLKLVLERETKSYQYSISERKLNFCNDSQKIKLTQFVERLLNNNEPRFFYLHAEPNLGLEKDYCAFLQLSVALKATVHYKTLLDAKILQLKDSFQHKLGFLVGQLYSRIGTEDWVPDNCTEEIFGQKVRVLVEDPDLCIWIEKENHKAVLKALENVAEPEQTVEKLEEILKEIKADKTKRRKDVYEIISERLTHFGVSPETITALESSLEINPTFRSKIK